LSSEEKATAQQSDTRGGMMITKVPPTHLQNLELLVSAVLFTGRLVVLWGKLGRGVRPSEMTTFGGMGVGR
jgi:hypothetical protein